MLKALRSKSSSYRSAEKDDFDKLKQDGADVDENAGVLISQLAPVSDKTHNEEVSLDAVVEDSQVETFSMEEKTMDAVSSQVVTLNSSPPPVGNTPEPQETWQIEPIEGSVLTPFGEEFMSIGSRIIGTLTSQSLPINDSSRLEETSIAESEYDKVPKPFVEETLVRTVSREGSGPMRHPAPDLQALQGAYISNIERLEQSAERLSMSSDIGEALRSMKQEQKRSESRRSSILGPQWKGSVASVQSVSRRFSSGSGTSNPIARLNSGARAGGYSQGAYIPSPAASLRSPSWTHHITQNLSSLKINTHDLSHNNHFSHLSEPQQELSSFEPQEPEEPPDLKEDTELPHEEIDEFPDFQDHAAYSENYQRATNLFADFDGVHIMPYGYSRPASKDMSVPSQRSSLAASIPANGPPRNQAPPGQVYYPAPIPKEIILPMRLSKGPPASQRDRERSRLFEHGDRHSRRSALWTPDGRKNSVPAVATQGAWHSQNASSRLRASVYWSHPSVPFNVEMIDGSPSRTLDTILEASSTAPVTAFTDHPIAGRVGAQVYKRSEVRDTASERPANTIDHRKSKVSTIEANERRSSGSLVEDTKRKFSILNPAGLFRRRQSSAPRPDEELKGDAQDDADLSHEGTPLRGASENGTPEQDGELDTEEDVVNAEQLDDDDLYTGAPTTLIAELQIRKQQQKQRNRTAATQNGMYSTLLEMDAVAQVQKQARKQKHVTLAWEEPAAQNNTDADEDVPLGILYPSRKANAKSAARFDENRPLGLIAQRDLEDNETMAQRRARLRGEILPHRPALPNKRASVLDVTLPSEQKVVLEEVEGETLGQRRRRLQAAHRNSTFSNEVLSRIGGPAGGKLENTGEAEVEDPDETLAQRRIRLKVKKETEIGKSDQSAARPGLQKRYSMAGLLSAHPIGSRTPSGGSVPQAAGHGGLSYRQSMPRSALNMNRFTVAGHNMQGGGMNNGALQGYGYTSPTAGPYQNAQFAASTVNNWFMPTYNYYGQPTMYSNPIYNGSMAPQPPPAFLPNPLYNQPRRQSSGPTVPVVDPSQLAMIDRWRSSVRQ